MRGSTPNSRASERPSERPCKRVGAPRRSGVLLLPGGTLADDEVLRERPPMCLQPPQSYSSVEGLHLCKVLPVELQGVLAHRECPRSAGRVGGNLRGVQPQHGHSEAIVHRVAQGMLRGVRAVLPAIHRLLRQGLRGRSGFGVAPADPIHGRPLRHHRPESAAPEDQEGPVGQVAAPHGRDRWEVADPDQVARAVADQAGQRESWSFPVLQEEAVDVVLDQLPQLPAAAQDPVELLPHGQAVVLRQRHWFEVEVLGVGQVVRHPEHGTAVADVGYPDIL
mmetsp:Transcript_95951/g.304636  ORF Transcript_95951/g.304636 Transcript_95951/m.304636 type:complete len:279 (+) Transcript_95951:3-839(+)